MPIQKEKVPIQKEEVSKKTVPIHKKTSAYSEGDHACLFRRRPCLFRRRPVPIQKETMPMQKEKVPIKKTVPIQKETMPIQKETMPIQKETMPMQKEKVPIQKEEVSIQKVKVPVPEQTVTTTLAFHASLSASKNTRSQIRKKRLSYCTKSNLDTTLDVLSMTKLQLVEALWIKLIWVLLDLRFVPSRVVSTESRDQAGLPLETSTSSIPVTDSVDIIPQIHCSNRFDILTDLNDSVLQSKNKEYREILDTELFETETHRYSANIYPISRKHRQQMMCRNKCRARKTKVKNISKSSLNDNNPKHRAVRQRGGGNGSVIFREDVDNQVSIEYSFDILSQCVEGVFEEELISTEAPIKPKGGDMFVIDTQNLSNRLSRRADQYLWVNGGSKKYPASSPVVIKSSWRVKTASGNFKNPKGSGSNAFKRTEYGLIGNERFFLVYYIGDEAAFENIPHGNAKKSGKNYVRTCPSTIESIKASLETGLTAGKVYNKLKSGVDGQAAVSRAPRNLKQVENIYMSMQRKKRLSQDDIYNTLELAYQLDGFVMQFDIFPSLLLVLGLRESVRDFNDLLQIKRSEKPFLSIDTTFETGNFYITPIVYKNFLFKSEPTVPLAFLIHQKKDQKFQERFLSVLSQECPNLKRKETIFVADRERALTNAISEKLPSATIVHCWNHVKRDVRECLKKRKAPSKNIDEYMNNLDTLLRCASEQDFLDTLDELSRPWCPNYLEYFQQNIKPEILKHSGKCLDLDSVANEWQGPSCEHQNQ